MGRQLAVALALVGCQPSAEPAPDATAASAAAPLTIDERDQYALLADIEAAVGDVLSRDAGAMASVRNRWEGKRLRWEVASLPLLCRNATSCNVAPFDHARFPERRITQGWMPQLELDDAGFAELGHRCAGRSLCVLEIEATMREFVFDPELATAVRFADVRVLGARDATPAESWIRSTTPLRRRS